jgi:hypothetical protein
MLQIRLHHSAARSARVEWQKALLWRIDRIPSDNVHVIVISDQSSSTWLHIDRRFRFQARPLPRPEDDNSEPTMLICAGPADSRKRERGVLAREHLPERNCRPSPAEQSRRERAMHLEDITLALFAACNFIRIFAYFPQIYKAATDKNGATAISYTTWGLFLIAHLSTIAYALVNRSDWWLAACFACNALCCLAILAVAYRKSRAHARALNLPATNLRGYRRSLLEHIKQVIAVRIGSATQAARDG